MTLSLKAASKKAMTCRTTFRLVYFWFWLNFQESRQRCAVEIIAAAIRGCKHWSYEKVEMKITLFAWFCIVFLMSFCNLSSALLL